MSRRPLLHPIGRLAKAQSRMAPGGLLWSESPLPRKFSPRVPMLGDDEAPAMECTDFVVQSDGVSWRPVGGGRFGDIPDDAYYQITFTLLATAPHPQLKARSYWDPATPRGGWFWVADETHPPGPMATDWLVDEGEAWDYLQFNYGFTGDGTFGRPEVADVKFCYTATPPTATATQEADHG